MYVAVRSEPGNHENSIDVDVMTALPPLTTGAASERTWTEFTFIFPQVVSVVSYGGAASTRASGRMRTRNQR